LKLGLFRWPPLQRYIVEGCDENGGYYADKSLSLWRIDAIRSRIPNSPSQPTARKQNSRTILQGLDRRSAPGTQGGALLGRARLRIGDWWILTLLGLG
jgi:hypothetical protein